MKPLLWCGDLESTSSYAQSARRLLPLLQRELLVRPFPLSLIPGTALQTDADWRAWLAAYRVGDTVNWGDYTPLYHVVPGGLNPSNPPGIIYSGWDARPYPRRWVEVLNQQQQFLTWSAWTATIARESGVTVPITVLPLPLPAPVDPVALPHDADRIVIGALGQAVPRKFMADVVQALWETFVADDGVEIVVKIGASPQASIPQILRDLHYRRQQFPHRPPTRVWVGEWTDAQLSGFYAATAIFVSLSTGEGYGLPMLEAAAHGAALVVADQAGGWEDWLPPEIPRVPSRWRGIPAGGIPDWQEDGMQWREADRDQWKARIWTLSREAERRTYEQRLTQSAAQRWAAPDAVMSKWSRWWKESS